MKGDGDVAIQIAGLISVAGAGAQGLSCALQVLKTT